MNTLALEFSARLAELLRKEQHAMADFLFALAEFDAKRLWVDLGHDGLFAYLYKGLKLSKSAASHRKAAVELIQAFPEVEAAFRSGQLCLSSCFELKHVLTRENLDEVLPRFTGLSRREAMQVSAALRPAAEVPERTVVLPLPDERRAALATRVEPSAGEPVRALGGMKGPAAERAAAPTVTAVPPFERPSRAEVRPLTAERSRMHVTVDAGFQERLQEARDAVSHSYPDASDGDLLELALEALLERTARRKGIGTRRPKTPRPAKPEQVPAHVLASAMERAGNCCEWRLASGSVCGSRRKLQPDHIVPVALGGTSDLGNIRITCRFHNLLAAREVFGDAWMDRFTRNPRAPAARRAAAGAGVGGASGPEPFLFPA